MTSEERDLITGLFNRLRAADTTPKDQEAEQLIGQLTGGQSGAAYRLVQTLLVQEHALNNATVRIQQLEKQVADARTAGQPSQGGSFLSGLFGHHTPDPAPAARSSSAPSPLPIPPQQLPQQQTSQYTQSAPPYPSTVGMAPSAGGGFLRGALQTAAGVAGGSLIAQGIENLMGHHYGPFGGYGGGGGGGFLGGGYGGGGGEIIENNNTTEVVNNYVDERGGGGGSEPGYQETQHEDNRGDVERGDGGGGAFTDAGFNTSNPFDAPADDPNATAMDNTFDADNTDAASTDDFAGDNSGGDSNDDSSTV